MKNIHIQFSVVLAVCSVCFGDTFTHYQTGELLHGYATTKIVNNKSVVNTTDGEKYLSLAEYNIEFNHLGRNDTVAIIPIIGEIESANQAEDFQEALLKEANKGHKAIIVEIDTPGGRVDYAMQICNAFSGVNCPVVVYICGGEYGGAFSAGAAISMACDKIYMSSNTVIGAATMIAVDGEGHISDMESAWGETVAEKMRSAWRSKLAAMAEQKNRPGMLAKAMEDKDIEVIEVKRNGEKMFISPVNKKLRDMEVKVWSEKGQLLTLTATDAVYCGMANKIVESREELLRDLDVADCGIVTNSAFDQATRDFQRANDKILKLASSIDVQIKKLSLIETRIQAARALDSLEKDFKQLKLIKRKYPDVELDEMEIQLYLNDIKALKSTL